MPTVGSLSVLLTGDASNLVRATRTGVRAVTEFGRAAGKVAALGGAAGLGALAVGSAGILALGNAARTSIDDIAKLSSRLGVTRSEGQLLRIALTQAAVPVRSLQAGMGQLSRTAGEAALGSAKAAAKFEALGISIEEVRALAPAALFRRVVEALGQVDTFAQRAALGNQLFAESWVKLNPLVDAGADAFRNADLVVNRLGLGLGQGAGQIEAMNDSMSTLAEVGTGLRDKVLETLAPTLSRLAEGVVEVVAQFTEAQGGGARVAEIFAGKLVRGAVAAISVVRQLGAVVSVVADGLGFLVKLVQSLGNIQGGILAGGAALLRGDFAGIGAIASGVVSDVSGRFGGDEEDALVEESRRQSELLQRIVEKEFGGAVFQ